MRSYEGGPETGGAVARQGGVLTLEPVTIDLPVEELEEVRDLWIEIRHRPDRNLVTAIEVLSPTNKAGEGFRDYRSKRRKLIRQHVHLVELDLLIRGQRLPMKQELPPGDFFVFVSRAERRPKCDVYGWSVRQALPRIPIPLLAPDPDVVLDLQPSSPPATTAAAMPGRSITPPPWISRWPRPIGPGRRRRQEDARLTQLERWTFAKAHRAYLPR